VFVDQATVVVRGGNGGAGVASFLRIKGRPRGKPQGGSGGSGGDVVVTASAGTASLLELKRHPHRRAGDGTHGEGDMRHGRNGDDLVISVPLGTIVRSREGTVLADLVEPGQRVVVAAGGRGGRGNASLVSRRHRAPGFAEQGEYGEELTLTLELKLMADAAIVGFPNAGKSTLISAVSAATPKIADYPFTTLEPHLGVVSVDDRELVLADIPGLIEGASEGKGLGHEFLRHTERARALVFLLDPSPLQGQPVTEQLDVLQRELESYSAELASRPRVVAVGKADLPEAAPAAAALQEQSSWAVHEVSAATSKGVAALMHAVADAVETAVRESPPRRGFVLHQPVPVPFEVRREGDGWRIEGRQVERAVALDDLTVPEAADFVADRLARLGVEAALTEAGAVAGDDVRIGGLVFDFRPLEEEDRH
jgi:GTP-binding protein